MNWYEFAISIFKKIPYEFPPIEFAAATIALALAIVSSHSACGFES
jgi:hypothetical protein